MMGDPSLDTKMENDDDDSFIILSSSPPPNVVFDFNGLPETVEPMLNASLHELMCKVSQESSLGARIAVIENGPSQSSLMVASTILSEKTPAELETSVGEIIEENNLLKETLKKNNDSLREQFLLIASCQEDMVKTHQLHKDKFSETKALVDKLRQENKTLKQEMMKLLDGTTNQDSDNETPDQSINNTMDSLNQSVDSLVKSAVSDGKTATSHGKSAKLNGESANLLGKSANANGESANANGKSAEPNGKSADLNGNPADVDVKSGLKSNASSMIEFVTSPDDDVIDKLTAQLELVEKQRRQVIIDNDKLTWQKESLERVVDATTKERDLLKMDVNNLKKNICKKESDHLAHITRLTTKIQELENTVRNYSTVSVEITHIKDVAIQQYEVKVATLQNELQKAQLKVVEYENVMWDLSQQKAAALEKSNSQKQRIQELCNSFKTSQTIMFQPLPAENASNPDYVNFNSHVKLYDSTSKQITELLNSMADGASDSLETSLSSKLCLLDSSTDTLKCDFTELVKLLEKQHENELTLMDQLQRTIVVLESILSDYCDLLKTSTEKDRQFQAAQTTDVEPLTSALLARAEELKAAKSEIADLRRLIVALREEKDEKDLLRAQLDVYKSDFLCEREAREKLACEKETTAAELRGALKKKKELTEQLEEVRKLNPNIHKAATTTKSKPRTLASVRVTLPEGSTRTPGAPSTTTANMVYTCPKCTRFSSDQYTVMEDHFDFCLDDF